MIICCHQCDADPIGRWKQPPAMIFHDRYPNPAKLEKAKAAELEDRGYLFSCREHVTPQRERELQQRERERGWPEGGLR